MFNKKKPINCSHDSFDIAEMKKFHLMLLKIKNRRPNFNVVRVMKMLYGKKFEEQRFED